MTTWEPAGEREKQEIRLLLARLHRAQTPHPAAPPTANPADLSRLTKRDAGTWLTQLREAARDVEQ